MHTFEFHSQRANEAEREFSEHGLSEVVTVCERDAERDGFPKLLHGRADAVFLDLPGPWKVIESTYQVSFANCEGQMQMIRLLMARELHVMY